MLMCILIDVIAYLQLMVSYFGHRDWSLWVIVHYQSQALTSRIGFLTNILHCNHNFLSGVNLKVLFLFPSSYPDFYRKTI